MRINPGLQVLSIVEGTIQIGTGQRARWITGLDPAEQQFVLSLCRTGAGWRARGGAAPAAGAAKRDPVRPAPGAHRTGRGCVALAGVLPRLPPLPPPRLPPAAAAARAAADGPGSSRLTPDILQWSAAYELDAGPVLRKRADARVAIHHLGRTGQMLAGILAASGIGSLLLCDAERMQPEDLGAATTGINSVGQLRTRAASRALAQTYPRLTLAETARRGPDAGAGGPGGGDRRRAAAGPWPAAAGRSAAAGPLHRRRGAHRAPGDPGADDVRCLRLGTVRSHAAHRSARRAPRAPGIRCGPRPASPPPRRAPPPPRSSWRSTRSTCPRRRRP